MFDEKKKTVISKGNKRNAAFSRLLIDCFVTVFRILKKYIGTNFLSMENLSLILCLKLLKLLTDFRSEFKESQILGPRWEKPFFPLLLFRKGLSSLF